MIRRPATLRASHAACSGPSSWVTPTRSRIPGPSTAPTTSPATVTLARETRCTTALMMVPNTSHGARPPRAGTSGGGSLRKVPLDDLSNPGSGMTVTERVLVNDHRAVLDRILDQPGRFLDDDVLVRADDASTSCLNGFRSFGHLTQDQDRLAEGGSLLLDASRVGQDEVGVEHQEQQGEVVHRIDQGDARMTSEQFPDGPARTGVQMRHENDVDVVVCLGDATQSPARVGDAFPEGLPTVGGDEQQLRCQRQTVTSCRTSALAPLSMCGPIQLTASTTVLPVTCTVSISCAFASKVLGRVSVGAK